MAAMGAFGAEKEIDQEALQVWGIVKNVAETEHGLTESTVQSVTTQVVAGMNYKFKVASSKGLKLVTVYKPLPHTGQPPRITDVSDV